MHQHQQLCLIDNARKFPEHCFFCMKIEKRLCSGGVDKMELLQKPLYPEQTKETFLTAARLKNDETLIHAIEHVLLGEKDFRKHLSCCKEYTKLASIASCGSAAEQRSNYELRSYNTKMFE